MSTAHNRSLTAHVQPSEAKAAVYRHQDSARDFLRSVDATNPEDVRLGIQLALRELEEAQKRLFGV